MAAVTSRQNAPYILSEYTVHSRLVVHSTDRIPEQEYANFCCKSLVPCFHGTLIIDVSKKFIPHFGL